MRLLCAAWLLLWRAMLGNAGAKLAHHAVGAAAIVADAGFVRVFVYLFWRVLKIIMSLL